MTSTCVYCWKETTELDERGLCPECQTLDLVRCEKCGELWERSDVVDVNGEMWCGVCVDMSRELTEMIEGRLGRLEALIERLNGRVGRIEDILYNHLVHSPNTSDTSEEER